MINSTLTSVAADTVTAVSYPPKVLALDQALVKSGYAIIDTTNMTISYGQIEAPLRQGKHVFDYWARVKFVKDTVARLIQSHNIEQLVLEMPFVSSRQHVSSGQTLQAVYAAIQILAKDLDLNVDSIPPTQWPKLLGLKSTKLELLDLLRPMGITTDHQSDAIGLGLAYLIKQQNNYKLDATVEMSNFIYINAPLYRLRLSIPASALPNLPAIIF